MTKVRELRFPRLSPYLAIPLLWLAMLSTGCDSMKFSGTSPISNAAPTVSVSANPASITAGSSSTLTVTASNATQVKLNGSDGTTYTVEATGGTQAVKPSATTTYTATA